MANMVAENQEGIDGNEHKFFGNIGRGPTQMGSRTLRMVLKEHSFMYTNKGARSRRVLIYTAHRRGTRAPMRRRS